MSASFFIFLQECLYGLEGSVRSMHGPGAKDHMWVLTVLDIWNRVA